MAVDDPPEEDWEAELFGPQLERIIAVQNLLYLCARVLLLAFGLASSA
jgi:hypothetical protein